MSTCLSALLHRIDNLYTFFFESCESHQELYYRQQNEYRQSVSVSKAIPLEYYPKNSFPMDNLPPITNGKPMPPTASVSMYPIDPNHQSSRSLLNNNNNNQASTTTNLADKNGQYEIDLD